MSLLKRKYSVEFKGHLDELDNKVLINLYQPIIGYNSLALYFTLISESEINKTIKGMVFEIERISQILGMTEQKLNQSLEKLEGTYLIKRMVSKKNSDLKFKISKPLTFSEFLNNQTLSITLEKKIGEINFEALKFIFKDYNEFQIAEDEEFEDITSRFIDVYEDDLVKAFNSESFDKKQKNLDDVKQVDVSLLENILYNDHGIIIKNLYTAKVLKNVNHLINLYSLPLEDFAKIINNNFNNDKKTVNWEFVEKELFQYNLELKYDKLELSNNEIELIKDMNLKTWETYYTLKTGDQPNLITLNSINKLKSKLELTDGVLNCIIDYIFIKNNGTIVYNYLEKIARTITSNSLRSVEQVMNFLKQTNKKTKTKNISLTNNSHITKNDSDASLEMEFVNNFELPTDEEIEEIWI